MGFKISVPCIELDAVRSQDIECTRLMCRSEQTSLSSHRMYLLISFRKSTPSQNRQLVIYYHLLKYQVGDFVEELTFENELIDALCQICSDWKLSEKLPACRQAVTPVHANGPSNYTNSQSWNVLSTCGDKCRQNGSKVKPISPKKEPWISLEGPCVSQIISVSPTRPHPLSKVDGSVPRSHTVNF